MPARLFSLLLVSWLWKGDWRRGLKLSTHDQIREFSPLAWRIGMWLSTLAEELNE